MGAYLSTPNTTKSSENHANDRIKCGASSMQGWRVSQEDAHSCCLDLTEKISLFGVYDGHGGREVAIYTKEHFPDEIKSNEHFKNGQYTEALKSSFLSFDKKLIDAEVVAELRTLTEDGDKGPKREAVDEEEDLGDLREEAAMPIELVIEKYKKKLLEAGLPPASPCLRGKDSKGESSSAGCSSSADCSSGTNNIETPSSSSSKQVNEAASSTSDVDVTSSCGSSAEPGPGPSSPPDSTSRSPRKSLAQKYSNGEIKKSETKENKEEEPVLDSTTGPEAPKVNGDAHSPKQADVSSSSDIDNNEAATKSCNESSISESTDKDEEELGDSDESDEDFSGVDDDDSDGDEEEDIEEEESDLDDDEDDDDEMDEDEDDCFTMMGSEEPGEDSGCTAVVALVLEDKILVANAGDSRCVASVRGRAVDLSIDHKPEDPEEKERINKAGGKVTSDGRVNGGLNLSRALGDHTYKKNKDLPLEEQMISSMPDVKELAISDDLEFLVLACDGIWNFMGSQEVVNYVRKKLQKKPKDLSKVCEELFDDCLAPNTTGDGTGCDNMTAVIVQFRPDQDLPEVDQASIDNEVSNEASKAEDESAVNAITDSAKRRSEDEAEPSSAKRSKTDETKEDPASTNE